MARSAQANCLNTVAAPKQARPKPRYPYIILLSLFFSDDFCRFMNRLTCPIENPAFLLPHSGHMVLIDRVTEHRADFVRVEAHIGEKHILLQNGVLPTTMGMEIMAQGVGAWAGVQALDAGRPVQLGFLLGTRKLEFGVPAIPVGTVMDVKAVLSWLDNANNMGVFDCTLAVRTPPAGREAELPAGTLLLSGALNVFMPKSQEALAAILAD